MGLGGDGTFRSFNGNTAKGVKATCCSRSLHSKMKKTASFCGHDGSILDTTVLSMDLMNISC